MSAGFAGSIYTVPVEAAGVVLLPLVNNTTEEDLDTTYYQKTLDAIKVENKYDLLDGEDVENAIKKFIPAGTLASKENLIKLSEAVNADLIIGIQLNELSYSFIPVRVDDTIKMNVKGNTVSYNNETGEYKIHKIYDESEYDYGPLARTNIIIQEWGNHVTREMKRAMKVKKVSFERPRLTKLK